MRVLNLELRNFRNLKDQSVKFPSRVTAIIGRNGQGKTSLLEAIGVLSLARSFRGAKPAELVRWKESQDELIATPANTCSVTAVVDTTSGEKKLSFQVVDARRKIFLNDKPVDSAGLFYGQMTALEFTPEDLDLIKGGPAGRRNLIDRILSMVDQTYVNKLVQYQRVLRSRNAVLAAAKQRGEAARDIETKLAALDPIIIGEGLYIASKRLELIAAIQRDFREIYRTLGSGVHTHEAAPQESAQLDYAGDFVVGSDLLTPEAAHELLQSSVSSDMRYQNTGTGIHRDNILISFSPQGLSSGGLKPARGVASQGQARSLALAIKLACARYLLEQKGEPPIILLDDVESELDQHRRAALFSIVSELESQVLVTATELSEEFQAGVMGMSVLRVEAGVVG